MSTHWKQNAFVLLAIFICILFGLIVFFYCSPIGDTATGNKQFSNKSSSGSSGSSGSSATTGSSRSANFKPTNNYELPKTRTTTFRTEIPNSTTITTNNVIDYDNDKFEIVTHYVNQSIIGDADWNTDDDIDDDIDEIKNTVPEELDVDYVKLEKIHNFSLNEDDLLYESKRNNKIINKEDYVSAFSLTGTFRSKSSQIWDPHPEYILNVFGRRLHLKLFQDTSFIPPKTFQFIRVYNNRTEEADDSDTHYLGCYYKGRVNDDEQTIVAVSLCNGMTGYIKTNVDSLLIKPVNQTSDNDADIVHKVWRHSRRNARHVVSGNLDMDIQVLEDGIQSTLQRKKRNYEDRHMFTIELLVAVDTSMKLFHGDAVNNYILTLISIVSNIFRDASIGNPIHISVVKILLLHGNLTSSQSKYGRNNASELLNNFCSFVSKRNYHYDTAMLITRDEICRNEHAKKCDTLGLADLGTICSRLSCSIVQDNGLPAAFTMAHELGHILNMPHDDDERCKRYNKPGKLHIMNSVMGDDIHPWSWSNCSRHYVSEFLEKEDKSCLEDTPTLYVPNNNTRLPGQIYSLDQQCQLIHGNQSQYCAMKDECKILWCKADRHHSNCRSSSLPWADGTPCRRHHTHWCQKGKCVSREDNTQNVVNGGWGAWSPFTPCSLTCGGGVQESQRECNNPLPKNGGKYCAGARKKYRSCNTQNCPPGSLDLREQQCYEMNGRKIRIEGIDPSQKWIPKYGLSPKDKCKLFCRLEDNSAYFSLSEKVKDGTPCSFDSFDKCVNGICRPAGCDNELNSIAKLDKCGVCEGRNDTCEEFTGNFYVSDLYKMHPNSKSYYYHVTVIPKGASNIVITQPGYHDENYIVLRDYENRSLLNGNQLISTYRNVTFYAGVTFEYNGSNSTVERVNTTYSRKLKHDLIVEIISQSTNAAKNNDSLLLTYTYTMDKPNYMEPELDIYRWEMQDWSNCDALCHGSINRQPVCFSVAKGLKVAPQFCDLSAKPMTEYRKCNTDCDLTLNVTSISECSAACGMWGLREKTYACIQKFNKIGRANIVDMVHCKSKFEISYYEQCREGCWDYTEWSACSKTCGTGSQTRSVACYLNQTRVSDEFCNPRNNSLRDTLRTCNSEPCYYFEENIKRAVTTTPNNWITGDWGTCNEKCEKSRTVSCLHRSGYGCRPDDKPLAKRKCCKIKYVTNWTEHCSVPCGTGIRQKEVYCARVYKPEIEGAPRRRVRIDQRYCAHLRRPTPKRTQKPCKVSCKWAMDNWTQCPVDCSKEYQTRYVYCASVFGSRIDYKYCDATKKPASRKICQKCVRRELVTISKCTCEGYYRQRVVCYNSLHKRIQCPTKNKIIKEKCTPPRECLPRSCEDIRRRHQTYKDGEYTIYVRARATKIYCHNMATTPMEYITLNSTENYSIYYNYKTADPDSCPPASRNREFYDKSISSGRTSFYKIRLNITDLRVIENDFTFADSRDIQQPYGSAGDCYNRNRECPQGDFSINLEGTGFYMRPGTIWNTFGESVVMKVSNSFETSRTTKRAFCGGYCGRCAISSHSGLFLDIV